MGQIVHVSAGFQPNPNTVRFLDDFLSSGFESALGWDQIVNGAGSGAVVDALAQAEIAANHPGVIRATTGTTLNGRGGLYLGRQSTTQTGSMRFDPAAGSLEIEWMVRIPVLSDGVDDFFLIVGFQNIVGGGANSEGLFFRLLATGNWEALIRSASLGTQTLVTTVVAPTTDWTRFRIEWDSINGARYWIGPSPGPALLVATIPPGSPGVPTGQLMSPLLRITKQAGVTPRDIFVDYCSFGYNLFPGR